jgi:hypothetical protein
VGSLTRSCGHNNEIRFPSLLFAARVVFNTDNILICTTVIYCVTLLYALLIRRLWTCIDNIQVTVKRNEVLAFYFT